MTLRPEFTLGHSPYNAFLFARVGEEQVGMPLTVLSALTRLGLDPWQEAARLAAMPRETAARVFAVTIAMLPEGDWKASDSEAIATRLVEWLPGKAAAPLPRGDTRAPRGRKMKVSLPTVLACGLLAIALAFLALQLLGADRLDIEGTTTESPAPPGSSL